MIKAFLNFILSERRTLYIFLSDIFVITGVLFLGWSPSRMIAFYYLEFCFAIFAYAAYNVIIKEIDFFNAIFATILIQVVLGIFFMAAILISDDSFDMDHPLTIYYPYFDVSIFIIGIISSEYLNVKKYLTIPKVIGKIKFSVYLATNFLLILGLLFIPPFFLIFFGSMKISSVCSLIIVRNFMEYKRYKSFQLNEEEINLLNTPPPDYKKIIFQRKVKEMLRRLRNKSSD